MKRGMEAIIERSSEAMRGKRTPMLKRKPNVAVMIAVGKPKMGGERTPVTGRTDDDEPMEDEQPEREDATDPAILLAKIRKLTKRVELLEAMLGDEAMEEDDEEDEDAEEMAE